MRLEIFVLWLFFDLLLTTFLMDLSQAMDFCSCWMHMANWAALRTSLRAFLHTVMPGATSSSPLGGDNVEGWEGDEKKEKTHTYVNIGVKSHKHKAVNWVEPGYILQWEPWVCPQPRLLMQNTMQMTAEKQKMPVNNDCTGKGIHGSSRTCFLLWMAAYQICIY